MEFKPNAYERDVLNAFKEVVGKTGYLKEFYFEEHNYGCGGMSIVKNFGKWTSYVYEKGSKIGQRWYDDIYDLAIDAFQTLSKDATDYCMSNFPSREYFEKREEERVNKEYKLYGTVNLLDIVPGFVYPVFEDENQDEKRTGKEFDEFNNLKFEGEIKKGERNGKGKEFDEYSNIVFEGEYLNGKRNGKGKEFNN